MKAFERSRTGVGQKCILVLLAPALVYESAIRMRDSVRQQNRKTWYRTGLEVCQTGLFFFTFEPLGFIF